MSRTEKKSSIINGARCFPVIASVTDGQTDTNSDQVTPSLVYKKRIYANISLFLAWYTQILI